MDTFWFLLVPSQILTLTRETIHNVKYCLYQVQHQTTQAQGVGIVFTKPQQSLFPWHFVSLFLWGAWNVIDHYYSYYKAIHRCVYIYIYIYMYIIHCQQINKIYLSSKYIAQTVFPDPAVWVNCRLCWAEVSGRSLMSFLGDAWRVVASSKSNHTTTHDRNGCTSCL